MRRLLLLACLFGLVLSIRVGATPTNASQIIADYGYPVEEHDALTPDGWELRIIRIPHGINGAGLSSGPKPVVFFQHGLTDSANGCLLNSPQESFPFIFADAGFDVWIGNNRGNGISMTNINYSPDQEEFWDFSWDEMALVDLPTQIEYVLAQTGVPTLGYIGHSEGTIQAFAGFSSNHTLASKVNVFIALAPVAYVGHVLPPLLRAMALATDPVLFDLLGTTEFAIPTAIDRFLPGGCSLIPEICYFTMEAVMGKSNDLNVSRVSYYLRFEPNPTSVKNMVHWSQGVRADTFARFDYGAAGNLQRYNSSTPPPYLLSNMPQSLPVALFTGGNDELADPTDVARMLQELSPPPFVHNEPTYAHIDPLMGENAFVRIYPIVLQLLQKYAPQL